MHVCLCCALFMLSCRIVFGWSHPIIVSIESHCLMYQT